ncbi:MAG: hypothetical protein JWQ81_858 [Amycolatopsis sp.]|uniref:hypothetical protein n=1 Tax=Amycolatopsis sp. TaxID=37632 RepID=UPI0026296D27|nr:hypothetical protein [Amycolatopsis sp.]MCU1680119.1 hypothetical protein [Amycolatopsis sp.]
MRAFDRIDINRGGVAEILHSAELHTAIQAAAEVVADTARGRDLRVESGESLPVEVFGDRGRSRVGVTVAVRHPAGVGMEAHHGVLKRAAVDTGLSVEGLRPDADT